MQLSLSHSDLNLTHLGDVIHEKFGYPASIYIRFLYSKCATLMKFYMNLNSIQVIQSHLGTFSIKLKKNVRSMKKVLGVPGRAKLQVGCLIDVFKCCTAIFDFFF